MIESLLYWIRNLRHRAREVTGRRRELPVELEANISVESRLDAVLIRKDGTRIDLGTLSKRLVTDAGVGFIVDAFQNLVELENMNFHGSGTGTTAEAQGDTALVTEVESRATGTQSEPAANQYRSVGTVSYTATRAITEHGLFSASTAGVLLDRSVFTAINVVNGDSIQFTYTLTLTAGS